MCIRDSYSLAFQVADIIAAQGIEAGENAIRENGWPMGKIMNCIRLALVGASSGLGIADIISLIGTDEFKSRIQNAKERLC